MHHNKAIFSETNTNLKQNNRRNYSSNKNVSFFKGKLSGASCLNASILSHRPENLPHREIKFVAILICMQNVCVFVICDHSLVFGLVVIFAKAAEAFPTKVLPLD